jgi:hypothetical protein
MDSIGLLQGAEAPRYSGKSESPVTVESDFLSYILKNLKNQKRKYRIPKDLPGNLR